MSYETIYLTEPANLSEGLYWARRIQGEGDAVPKGLPGKWSIICIVGTPPFLDGYVIAYSSNDDRGEPWRMGYTSSNKYDMRISPNEWEFGPRIGIPSDKSRVEHAPIATESKP